MKKKNLTIIFIPIILLLIIGLSSVIFFNIITHNEVIEKKSDKKVRACEIESEKFTLDQIKKGIKIKLAINSNEIYDFYVIDNDDFTVSLILASNLHTLSSFSQTSNMEGPISVLEVTASLTSTWENIEYIPFYLYSDYGLQKINYYEEEYDASKNYDAFVKNPGGYSTLNITEGQVTITEALTGTEVAKTTTLRTKSRARLITYEELEKLMTNKKLPNWLTNNLNDNEGFWTMSTAPNEKSNSTNAFAVIKNSSKSNLEAKEINSKLLVNPVITISRDLLSQIVK